MFNVKDWVSWEADDGTTCRGEIINITNTHYIIEYGPEMDVTYLSIGNESRVRRI